MEGEKSGGIGVVSILTIVFVVLQLVGVISWSWWWVLSPLWISAGVAIVVLIFVVIIAVIKTRRREPRLRKYWD